MYLHSLVLSSHSLYGAAGLTVAFAFAGFVLSPLAVFFFFLFSFTPPVTRVPFVFLRSSFRESFCPHSSGSFFFFLLIVDQALFLLGGCLGAGRRRRRR